MSERRPGGGYLFLGTSFAPEEDPASLRLQTTVTTRNGLPDVLPYRRSAENLARDREVAEFVAYAQARADAMPGAVPRCTNCRKPAAECVCHVHDDWYLPIGYSRSFLELVHQERLAMGRWWTVSTPAGTGLAIPIERLWPGKRTASQTQAVHCLLRAGIATTADLTGWSAKDLLGLRAFGVGALAQLRSVLAAKGLYLEGEQP